MGVAILFTLLLFFPLSTLVTSSEELRFDVMGVYGGVESALLYSTWGLLAIAVMVILLSLATIVFFNKRMIQIRLSIFTALLAAGFYGLFGFFAWILSEKFAVVDLRVAFALSFPAISIILLWLAIRSIGADEALVRSLNRLR